MELKDLQADNYRDTYLKFDSKEYGRIFAFVDFANVRHWAKSFWPIENKEWLTKEIDIAKLGSLIDSINPEKKFFYYGHYPEYPELDRAHTYNVRYRKSIYRLSKAQTAKFTTRTKDIKEIKDFDEDGKYSGTIKKCNFDIEMAMDMLTKIEKYDTVFLWSGDSDFHLLLQYLQSKKKKIIVVCARSFVSKELDSNSDLFIPADPFKEILEYVPAAPHI